MHLKRFGYVADLANNGLEAIALMKICRSYKLIFMDCHMPEMDGYTCTREIRKEELLNNHTPIFIVAVTGGTSEKESCIECGMNDFLTKPVRSSDIQSILIRLKMISGKSPLRNNISKFLS